MRREPLGEPHLLRPSELLLRILRELDVVRRVGIDEIALANREALEVARTELPVREHAAIGAEVGSVTDSLVTPERDVELPFAVEAAKPVVACAVQIVEKRRASSLAA